MTDSFRHMCIYHFPCQDGYTAAWVVRKALGEESVEFFPYNYYKEPPDVTGRDVIIVDFSFKRAVLEDMASKAKSILILDHHKSAEEDLKPPLPSNVIAIFRMDRSGAGLAWEYFFPYKDFPNTLLRVEDRDIWRFKYEDTNEVFVALASYPYEWDIWDKAMNDDGWFSLRSDGIAILRKHNKDIEELLRVLKRRMTIGGYNVPVANLPYLMASDAGNIMCQGEPFAATYSDSVDKRKFSLRSSQDGVDVSKVAEKYGGGGHAHASGFEVSLGWEGDA